jgi:hypothetical protein
MRTRIFILTVLAVIVLGAATAHAQTLQVRQYAAKFICGKASDEQEKLFLAAPGLYYTAINVHNPALTTALKFRKKFTVGLPGEKVGKISEFFTVVLKADETMQIDCGDIYGHLGIAPGTFIEGFAVLQVTPVQRELDVVGVYTAAGGAGVSTLHLERVTGRVTQ